MTDKLEAFKNLLYHYTTAVQAIAAAEKTNTVSALEKREMLMHRSRLIAYVEELMSGPKDALTLPDALIGHWDTTTDAIMARELGARDRIALSMAEISDYTLANSMALELKPREQSTVAYAVKQRLRWLSVQLARRA